MSDDHKRPAPDMMFAEVYEERERQCLMCQVTFVSEWSGERICRKCKSKSIWREGFLSPSGGRPV